jgi:predicted DCC family thiol-disulfide oxidoreductase YuxK
VLTRPVLLYDGDCGFCLTWVGRLTRWDMRHAIDYVPSRDRGKVSGLPAISDERLDRAMHLVLPNGEVHAGAQALPHILPLLPGGRLLAPLLKLPGAQSLADQLYAWIASRRHRLGCSPTCRIGSSRKSD